MNKTTTTARIRPDGTVVEILDDGTERPFPGTPMRPMSEAEIEAAAAADPDARPMAPEELAKARRVPRVRTSRRALGLTQEEFAARYHIPLGTLRDWEQGRTEPDQPTRAYLTLIARDPEHVDRVLNSGARSSRDESPAAAARRLATFGKRHGLSSGGRTVKKLVGRK